MPDSLKSADQRRARGGPSTHSDQRPISITPFRVRSICYWARRVYQRRLDTSSSRCTIRLFDEERRGLKKSRISAILALGVPGVVRQQPVRCGAFWGLFESAGTDGAHRRDGREREAPTTGNTSLPMAAVFLNTLRNSAVVLPFRSVTG